MRYVLGKEHCPDREDLRRLELLPLLKSDDIFLMTSSPDRSELPASVLAKSQKKRSLENTKRRDPIFSSELSEGATVETLGYKHILYSTDNNCEGTGKRKMRNSRWYFSVGLTREERMRCTFASRLF